MKPRLTDVAMLTLLLPLSTSFNPFVPRPLLKSSESTVQTATPHSRSNPTANPTAPFLLPFFLASSLIFTPPPTTSSAVLPQFLPQFLQTPSASAKEMASGSGSKVNKDAESLLRYGLPGIPKEGEALREALRRDLYSSSALGSAYPCHCHCQSYFIRIRTRRRSSKAPEVRRNYQGRPRVQALLGRQGRRRQGPLGPRRQGRRQDSRSLFVP